MSANRIIWSALRWSGVPYLMREVLQRRKVTILCYHDPDPTTLSQHLTALEERYTFIPLRDYVEARRSDSLATLPRRALVLTLDDGHRGNSQLLEVFRQHAVVATIFLASGIVGTSRRFWWTALPPDGPQADLLKTVPDADRVAAMAALGHPEEEACPVRSALSRAEVETLKSSVDLQSHTVLHPILSRCSDERAWTEIAQSKVDLENEYGVDVYALAYPNGTSADVGQREATMAAQAGYRCAAMAVAGLNDDRTDLFRLRRIVVPDDASVSETIVRASLLHACLRRLLPSARS